MATASFCNDCDELLKVLDLSRCQLRDDGAVKVAAFIKVDDTVEELRLWNNNIGPRGNKALADALNHNKAVRRL